MITLDSELLNQFPVCSDVYYISPINDPQFPFGVSRGKVVQVGFKFLENNNEKFIPYVIVKEENSTQMAVEISNLNLISLNKKDIIKIITDFKREWESASEKLNQLKKDLNWGNYAKLG